MIDQPTPTAEELTDALEPLLQIYREADSEMRPLVAYILDLIRAAEAAAREQRSEELLATKVDDTYSDSARKIVWLQKLVVRTQREVERLKQKVVAQRGIIIGLKGDEAKGESE